MKVTQAPCSDVFVYLSFSKNTFSVQMVFENV